MSTQFPEELPWLDTLSEDWVSEPRQSSSSIGTAGTEDYSSNLTKEERTAVLGELYSVPHLQNKSCTRHIVSRLQSNAPSSPAQKHGFSTREGMNSNHLRKIPPDQRIGTPRRRRSASLSSVTQPIEGSVKRQRRNSLSLDESHIFLENHLHDPKDPRCISNNVFNRGNFAGHTILEHLFRQPELSDSKLYSTPNYKAKDPIPSSPPPLPSWMHSGSKDRNRITTRLYEEDKSWNLAIRDSSQASPRLHGPGENSLHSPEDRKSASNVGSSSSQTCVPAFEVVQRCNNTSTSSDRLSENIELSPVYVSKHSTIDGHVKYSAFDKSTVSIASQEVGDDCNDVGQGRRSQDARLCGVNMDALKPANLTLQERLLRPSEIEHQAISTGAVLGGLEETCPDTPLTHQNSISETIDSSELNHCRDIARSNEDWICQAAVDMIDIPGNDGWSCGTRHPLVFRAKNFQPQISGEGSVDVREKDQNSEVKIESSKAYEGDRRSAVASLIGKKRKTARYEPNQNCCNPESLSKREILRPKNLAIGSHRPQLERCAASLNTKDDYIASHLAGSSTKALERSGLTKSASRETRDEESERFVSEDLLNLGKCQRKPSISTQDYLNEAMKIMEFIRLKNHCKGELGDLVETFMDASVVSGSAYGRLTPQSLSRPPSRDGGLSWRRHSLGAVNPSILAHLRHYEEENEDVSRHGEQSRQVEIPKHAIMLKDIPKNVQNWKINRLIGGIDSGSLEDCGKDQRPLKLRTSLKQHARDYTVSGAMNIATIGPSQVAHLIGSAYGKMRFDNISKKWIKRDSDRPINESTTSSSGTEQSPFDDISDLEVDITREASTLQPLQPLEPLEPAATVAHKPTDAGPLHQLTDIPTMTDSKFSDNNLSTLSPDSGQAELGYKPRTPVTEAIVCNTIQRQALSQNCWAEAEFKDSAMERTSSEFGMNTNTEPTSASVTGSCTDNANPISYQTMSLTDAENYHNDILGGMAVSHSKPRRYQGPVAQPCQRSRTEDHRAVSFIHTNPDGRTMSLSFSVSTPARWRRLPQEQSMIRRTTLEAEDFFSTLTPMPAELFNLQSLPSRPQELPTKSWRDDERKFTWLRHSAAIDNLVSKLTEAEPDEPYWDWMTNLCLSSSELESLYMLDDFCPRIQNLSVCHNRLKYLDGLPASIRQLNARRNQLSSLTGWNHLLDLQYLDISDNDLNDLNGLANLKNLRELRADRNRITSLDGIQGLSGLLCLSVASNNIHAVDFSESGLDRLNSLCLSGNEIEHVSSVECLKDIQSLDLRDNRLKQLSFGSSDSNLMVNLRTVYVDDNDITALDLSHSPGLELLSADRNSIVDLIGLVQHPSLHTLSLRNQKDYRAGAAIGEMWMKFYEMRHLHLSGNSIPTFPKSEAFLNLHTLEMANCGTLSLHHDFGDLAPNLRSLDIRDNSIKDVRPLQSLGRLKKLILSGNTITRLRRTIAVIGCLSQLEELDLRDNPMTAKFYASCDKGDTKTSSVGDRYYGHWRGVNFRAVDESERVHKKISIYPQQESGGSLGLKRKVYELFLASQCRKLVFLDGSMCHMSAMKRKDEHWNKLLEIGVITRSQNRRQ